MTARTRTLWRNTAGAVAVCLAGAALLGALWYRMTYHVFPGMMPSVVHWCGRDYQAGGGSWTWARVSAEEAPRRVRVAGSYPPLFGGRPLLAAPGDLPVPAGQVCAMIVYLRTGPGRYQPYTLEGGP